MGMVRKYKPFEVLARTSSDSVQRVWIAQLPRSHCRLPYLSPFEGTVTSYSVPQGFVPITIRLSVTSKRVPDLQNFCSTQSRSGLGAGPFRSVALRCRSAACGVRVPGASDSKGTEAGPSTVFADPASLLRRYVAPDHRLPPRIDWVNAACLLFRSRFRDIGGIRRSFTCIARMSIMFEVATSKGYLLMET